MYVSLKDGNFNCFGCSKSGNIYDLVAAIENVDSLHAAFIISKITKKYKGRGEIKILETYEKPSEELLEDAKCFFYSLPKTPWDTIQKNYMFKRGFKKRTLRQFDVRINPSSNYPTIIPLKEQGIFKGYVCRRADHEEPKYLYNDGFSKKNTLFGDLEKGLVMVVEGSLDRMKVHQHGFKNVAALLGWKCSEYQAELLDKYSKKILCATDNDEAGEKGYDYLKSIFKKKVIRFRFPNDIKDPDEMDSEIFWQSYVKSTMKF
jgi:DNA primase